MAAVRGSLTTPDQRDVPKRKARLAERMTLELSGKLDLWNTPCSRVRFTDALRRSGDAALPHRLRHRRNPRDGFGIRARVPEPALGRPSLFISLVGGHSGTLAQASAILPKINRPYVSAAGVDAPAPWPFVTATQRRRKKCASTSG